MVYEDGKERPSKKEFRCMHIEMFGHDKEKLFPLISYSE